MSQTFSARSRNVSLVVAASMFMQILDGVIIVTALPQMALDFGVATLDMSIGITAYMLMAAVIIPTAGWLTDRFGARRVFLTAMFVFTLASLACGLAADLPQFVLARIVQGAGGALMFPIGRVIVLRSVAKSEIVPAIGLTVWPALFAPVVGPAIGGFLTTYVSWHWNFWINVPLGIAGMLLVLSIIPRDTEFKTHPFDWLGFALTGISLSTLLYGFDGLAQGTLPLPVAVGLAILGLGVGTSAIVWLRRAAHPLLDLNTLRIPTFAASEALAGAVLRLTINATPFLLPLMFQVGFGLDPLAAGGLVLVYFLGNLLMKSVTTPILRRFGFRTILAVNGTLAGLSIVGCGFLTSGTFYPLLLAILFVAGLTRSMQFTALATLAFADVDGDKRSSASTLSSMFQQISMVFGVALAAAILNVSQVVRAAPALALDDFRNAFLVIGALCVAASLQLLVLPRDAGSEVSGHRRTQAA
jgi:EmrB/QacA subfamily drug resistance transporter